MKNKEMDLEKFGEIIGDLLKEAPWQLVVTSEPGTDDVECSHSLGLGCVPQLYALLKAIGVTFKEFVEMTGGARNLKDGEVLIDAIIEMVKGEMLAVIEGEKEDECEDDKDCN